MTHPEAQKLDAYPFKLSLPRRWRARATEAAGGAVPGASSIISAIWSARPWPRAFRTSRLIIVSRRSIRCRHGWWMSRGPCSSCARKPGSGIWIPIAAPNAGRWAGHRLQLERGQTAGGAFSRNRFTRAGDEDHAPGQPGVFCGIGLASLQGSVPPPARVAVDPASGAHVRSGRAEWPRGMPGGLRLLR